MEQAEEIINFEEQPRRRTAKKGPKHILSAFLMAIVSIAVLAGAFLLYKYFFPSDKQLFVFSHYNTYQDAAKTEVPQSYIKTANVTCKVDDGVMEPEMVKAVNGFAARTVFTQLSNSQKRLEFALNFFGSDLITAQSVTDEGKTVFSSPQVADTAFSGKSNGEILGVLLGVQGMNADKGLLDGVDRDTFNKYLKKYGLKFYDSVPDTVFSSISIKGTSTVTLNAKAVQLFSGIVGQLRADKELKAFLYTQREQIAANLNEIYEPSTLLVSSVTQTEFEQSYLEALDSFLANLARSDAEVEITAVINKHRRIESETMKIIGNGALLFELKFTGVKNFSVTGYKEDGTVLFTFANEQQTAGTVTDSVTTFSLDVSKSTAESVPKMVNVKVTAATDTNVSESEIVFPEHCTDLSETDAETKQSIADEVNRRLSEIFTRAALGFLMFNR